MTLESKAMFRVGYVDIYGVRISPGQLFLQSAFEGKIFCEKITIRNISDKPVILRSLPPELSVGICHSYKYSFKKKLGLEYYTQPIFTD